jgi:outer membrane lipoprotein-sorting protein
MVINRRDACLGFVLAGAAPPGLAKASVGGHASPLSATDSTDVARVVDYLQGLTTARGRFVQTDARGGQASGTFYLQRPGLARFDYDPPTGLTIVSDGRQVSEVDRRLKTRHSYPLGWTPLALFLGKDIRLDRRVRVTRVLRGSGTLQIIVEDASARSQGAIALDFSDAPLALSGWSLMGGRGNAVTVRLKSFAPVEPRDPAFFTLAGSRPPPAPTAEP